MADLTQELDELRISQDGEDDLTIHIGQAALAALPDGTLDDIGRIVAGVLKDRQAAAVCASDGHLWLEMPGFPVLCRRCRKDRSDE